MTRLLGDKEKADFIKAELFSKHHTLLNNKQISALGYAKELTINPGEIKQSQIQIMRENSSTVGEILEINQVSAYFNYANRTVLGLGVSIEGDEIGLSPNNSDDLNDWNHK